MTTTETDTQPAATADEIDAAILQALADVARRVPGTPWQQSQAVVRLWHAWKIYALKVRGRTYLSLSDATDALIVAKQLGTTPRVLPVMP